jgi:hypothetical protein
VGDDLEPSMQLDVLAAMLLAERRDGGDLLDHLAARLGAAFPDWTQVERGGWVFSRARRVARLTLDLSTARYTIAREAHGPVARRARIVRGIEIGSTVIPLDAWVGGVLKDLEELSTQNEAARRALNRLTTGG